LVVQRMRRRAIEEFAAVRDDVDARARRDRDPQLVRVVERGDAGAALGQIDLRLDDLDRRSTEGARARERRRGWRTELRLGTDAHRELRRREPAEPEPGAALITPRSS